MNTIVYKIQENKVVKWVLSISLLLFFAYYIGKMMLNPGMIRLLLASAIVLILFAVSRRKPAVTIYALIVFLPFLGIIRRILIPVAGWSSNDPIVIIGPSIVLLLTAKWFYEKYIRRETIANDTQLFRLVRAMIIVDVIQIFNPLQGSLLTGIAGAIFYTVPVCYMVIGREYFNENWLKRIYATVFFIGIIAAVYGYKQFWFGLYPFEEAWVELSGYTALKVYDVTRPISMFSNAAEYAHYLGVAAVIGWGYFLRGKYSTKIIALISVAVLYSALFIESGRGIIVTTTVALTIMTILSVKTVVSRLLISCIAFASLLGLFAVMSKLNTENDLIYHSVSGLTDPFGEHSTLPGHIDLLFAGLIKGIMNPLGYGLGSTTIAAGKFTGSIISSEVDFSNKFLATGIIGGVIYLTIIIKTSLLAMKQAISGSSTHLIILGIVITEGANWLTGGHYSVVPLIWISIAFLDITSAVSNKKMTNLGETKNIKELR
ncbi:hypothetical protein [Paenibacillus hamazuiensis]|uniref:hypothetical protein n=1 Tax=Paenibacillus hamazuiensis TaxID=2936508 RepID=UPI0020105D7F|nr:hypothetical protein [Paenibacillus hamazuiensis]